MTNDDSFVGDCAMGSPDPAHVLSRQDNFRMKVAAARARLAAASAVEKRGRYLTPINEDMGSGEKLALLAERFGDVGRCLNNDQGLDETNQKLVLRSALDQLSGMAMMWRASL